MRVLLVILVAFFVLFLGATLIVFLHDHLSGFSIWNSPIWKTWKTPLIVFAVILGLALLTTAASLSSKKHERTEKDFYSVWLLVQ